MTSAICTRQVVTPGAMTAVPPLADVRVLAVERFEHQAVDDDLVRRSQHRRRRVGEEPGSSGSTSAATWRQKRTSRNSPYSSSGSIAAAPACPWTALGWRREQCSSISSRTPTRCLWDLEGGQRRRRSASCGRGCEQREPQIIYCSLTCFGETGPRRGREQAWLCRAGDGRSWNPHQGGPDRARPTRVRPLTRSIFPPLRVLGSRSSRASARARRDGTSFDCDGRCSAPRSPGWRLHRAVGGSNSSGFEPRR